jgi:hypothetical protein
MKKLLMSAAAIAAMSTGAFAADQSITLGATVAPFVTLAAPGGGSNATVGLGLNGTLTNADIVKTLAVVCNSACNATVAGKYGADNTVGMKLVGPAAAGGFANEIAYTATATGVSDSGPTSGDLTVTIKPSTISSPLVAGGYSGTLVVTVSSN